VTWADSTPSSNRLLGSDDPSPVVVANPGGTSPFLLIGDHAGRAIPARLGDLGVGADDLARHIACDIGVAALGARLSAALDACFISQVYSRLVIDCNRRFGDAGSIAAVSDGVVIAGNQGLTAEDIAERRREIYQPYHDAIGQALDGRAQAGRRTLLVSLHSFTPSLAGERRPWRMGVLHRGDSHLSHAMLALLRRELGEAAGDNQPYRLDETDNTVPLHADPRGLDYLELEVRQDLIADAAGQTWAADLLARLLPKALGSA
jgi:predicted N-formylglutamate amidohydrolase